jgi:hypothetical protein
MSALAFVMALLAQQPAPCPIALPNGTAVRGGFAPSRSLPDFTIRNREQSPVLVKLEQTERGEDHVYFIDAEAEMTIRGVPLGSYFVSVAVNGRFAPDCRKLASATAIYRFDEPFVFTSKTIQSLDGSFDTQMEGHWIELGNDNRDDAGAAPNTVTAFNG